MHYEYEMTDKTNKIQDVTNLMGRYLNRGTVEHLRILDSELVGSF